MDSQLKQIVKELAHDGVSIFELNAKELEETNKFSKDQLSQIENLKLSLIDDFKSIESDIDALVTAWLNLDYNPTVFMKVLQNRLYKIAEATVLTNIERSKGSRLSNFKIDEILDSFDKLKESHEKELFYLMADFHSEFGL